MNRPGWTRYLSTPGWMLFLGVLAASIGARGTSEWEQMTSALRGYYAISLVAGLALLTGGAMSLWARPRKRWIPWAGLAAALALGVNQAIGLWAHIIPGYTPG